ncbi:hypothetical protein Nepgr_004280 [Nepenthes gracilis]|uniref:Uncharacterized protein n=1 Tax=Nepenthes gracilis TaxID=150966 RepID=A0AAD3S153_NEPGR|nr:hypothetical protein Nepgr_004280 [Nepenthes gracilis]
MDIISKNQNSMGLTFFKIGCFSFYLSLHSLHPKVEKLIVPLPAEENFRARRENAIQRCTQHDHENIWASNMETETEKGSNLSMPEQQQRIGVDEQRIREADVVS